MRRNGKTIRYNFLAWHCFGASICPLFWPMWERLGTKKGLQAKIRKNKSVNIMEFASLSVLLSKLYNAAESEREKIPPLWDVSEKKFKILEPWLIIWIKHLGSALKTPSSLIGSAKNSSFELLFSKTLVELHKGKRCYSNLVSQMSIFFPFCTAEIFKIL